MISKMLFGANGYIQKGYSGFYNINAFRFDTQAMSTLSVTWGQSGAPYNSCCNSNRKGYSGGQWINGQTAASDGMYALVFGAKETTATLSVVLAAARYWSGSVNSTTKGYWCGGYNGSNGVSTIDGLTFSNETKSNPSATMPSALWQCPSTVCSSAKGYVHGGFDGSLTQNIVQAVTYSNETTASLGAVAGSRNRQGAGINSSTNGYIAVGWISDVDPLTSAPNASPIIRKVVFSTDTFSTFGSSLGTGRMNMSGYNNATVGYITGGNPQLYSGTSTTLEKLVFATETLSTVSSASMFGQSTSGFQNGGFL